VSHGPATIKTQQAMPTAIIRRAILNIEGKAKATTAVPQPKPGVVKTYYKSQQIRVNSEWKASKKKKTACWILAQLAAR
jgi:hypothetical protein